MSIETDKLAAKIKHDVDKLAVLKKLEEKPIPVPRADVVMVDLFTHSPTKKYVYRATRTSDSSRWMLLWAEAGIGNFTVSSSSCLWRDVTEVAMRGDMVLDRVEYYTTPTQVNNYASEE